MKFVSGFIFGVVPLAIVCGMFLVLSLFEPVLNRAKHWAQAY